MKLVFVQDFIGYHFGIMYISAVLKEHGHSTDIFVEGLETDLIDAVCRAKPDLIGFSSVTGTQRRLRKIVSGLKKRTDVPIIVGGAHPTYFPETIKMEGVDIICIGEGEYSVLELANRIERKEDYYNIPGLYFKKNGRIITNKLAPLPEDLDKIPFPDRHIYLKYPFYQDPKEIYLNTSRGCPWKCSFCYNANKQQLYQGNRYVRLRSVKNIIEEMEDVKKEFKNIRFLIISDDIIGINKKWLVEFCDEYGKKINIPFLVSIRADLITEFAVKKLKEANCFCLSVGVESGDASIRNTLLGKNTDDEVIIRAGRLIKEAGIKLKTTNMFFLPGETLEKAFKTIYVNKEMGTDYPWAFAFQPYPNTPLHKYAVENHYLDEDFSFEDIDPLGLVKSPIKLEEKDKILVLQRLFYYAVKIPGFTYLLKLLVHIPNNFVFDALHKLSFLIMYVGYHRISLLRIFKIALESGRQIKQNACSVADS